MELSTDFVNTVLESPIIDIMLEEVEFSIQAITLKSNKIRE